MISRFRSPGVGQVLIKVKASGICGSDIHYIYHGHKGDKTKGTAYLDVVAGHEPCGEVVARGPNCRHFGTGDRVIVYHISGCGFCRNCRRGFQISCSSPERKAYGWQRDGGHAEYLVADEKDLIHLPGALSWQDGSFISCGVGTAYEGVLRAGISGSDTVLIVGLGPVGMAAAMLAKGRGARLVLGVDVQPTRVEDARRLGVINEGFGADADTLGMIREVDAGRRDPDHRLLGSSRWAVAGAPGLARMGPDGLSRRDRTRDVSGVRRSDAQEAHSDRILGHEPAEHGAMLWTTSSAGTCIRTGS